MLVQDLLVADAIPHLQGVIDSAKKSGKVLADIAEPVRGILGSFGAVMSRGDVDNALRSLLEVNDGVREDPSDVTVSDEVEAKRTSYEFVQELLSKLDLRQRTAVKARGLAKERGLGTPQALHGAEFYLDLPPEQVVRYVIAALGFAPERADAAVRELLRRDTDGAMLGRPGTAGAVVDLLATRRDR